MFEANLLKNIDLEVLPISIDLEITERVEIIGNGYQQITKDVSFKSNENSDTITLGFNKGYYPVIDELIKENLIELSETKFVYNAKTHVIFGEYKSFKFVVGECYPCDKLTHFKEIPRYANIQRIKFD